jgi:hypothetical protein
MIGYAESSGRRSFFSSIIYWFLRGFGPLIILFCTLGLSTFVWWFLVLPQLLRWSFSIQTCAWLCLTILMYIPVIMVTYCIILLTFIDGGSTQFVMASPKYRHFSLLSDEFLSSIPTCLKCGLPKPPRSHHCSTCRCCHLRMDHHCPAIGRCIGLRNHQTFLVMLHWSSTASFCYAFLSWAAGSMMQTRQSRHVMSLLTILIGVLFLSLLFFLIDQLYRLRRNVTTIEMLENSRSLDNSEFDLGVEENFAQMFGRTWYRRWWPRIPDLCGFEWATNEFRRSTYDPTAFFA